MSDARQHEIDRLRIAGLERELDEAHERIRQLEALHFNAGWAPPDEIGLTAKEATIVAVLVGREGVVTTEQLMHALYALRPDEPPQVKIIDVFVCKARKKLKPFGIEIRTHWGAGYSMPAESQAALINWQSAAA